MTDVIVTALITGTFSVLASASLVNWRLSHLEKKVDEHNGYAKMYAETHEDIACMKLDIQWMKEKMKEGKAK